MTTYLVTGGAGFIGSNLIKFLNSKGQTDIFVVDSLGKTGKWKNMVGLSFLEYFEKEVFREMILNNRFPKVDIVFHLGACSSTSEMDASYLVDNNYRFSCQLCNWAMKQKARFVYASSAATYGDGSNGYSDDIGVLPHLKPLNMYGYSKHLFDLWAFKRGLFSEIVGIKYFNVYGYNEEHKGAMRSVVSKAFEQIQKTGEMCLFKSHNPKYKDGEQYRDFIFIEDAVKVTFFLGHNLHCAGIFNCGTGRKRTWLDLANSIFQTLNKPLKIRFVDIPEDIRAAYQYDTEADISKLRMAGYHDQFLSLEAGVRQYVQFLCSIYKKSY